MSKLFHCFLVYWLVVLSAVVGPAAAQTGLSLAGSASIAAAVIPLTSFYDAASNIYATCTTVGVYMVRTPKISFPHCAMALVLAMFGFLALHLVWA